MALTFNKILFLDLETTGLDKAAHGVHEIAGIIQMPDGAEVHFQEHVRPHPFAQFDETALKVSGVKQSDLMKYKQMDIVFRDLVRVLSICCDSTNPQDKMVICGYGSGECDQPFFRQWFKRNGREDLFKAFFHSMSEDISTLAIRYMRKHGISPKDLKLSSVAKALGIEVQTDKLHGAMYDVELAREVYKIVVQ